MTIYRHRVSGPGAAGDVWTTTLHSSGAGSLATVHTAWTTLVNGFLSTTLNAIWPDDQRATEVVTDQLDAVTGKNVAQARGTISQVGTNVGGTISQRSCIVIGLRTAVPTRSGRGRMYWPPPAAGHLDNAGNLLSATASTISTAFASRLNTFKATSTPIIYHRPSKTFDTVTTVTVGVVLGTQVRRTNRVFNAYNSATV